MVDEESEVLDAGKTPTANRLLRDDTEPAFHKFEAGSVIRREVDMEASVAGPNRL